MSFFLSNFLFFGHSRRLKCFESSQLYTGSRLTNRGAFEWLFLAFEWFPTSECVQQVAWHAPGEKYCFFVYVWSILRSKFWHNSKSCDTIYRDLANTNYSS